MKSVLKVVASVAFLSGVSVAANAVVFDDFTDLGSPTFGDVYGGTGEGADSAPFDNGTETFSGTSFEYTTTATGALSQTGVGGVLGGSRTIGFDFSAANPGTTSIDMLRHEINATGESGEFNGLALNRDASAGGQVTFDLTYDAAGAGLGLDLSTTDALVVDYWFFDGFAKADPQSFFATLSDGAITETLEVEFLSPFSTPDSTYSMEFVLADLTSAIDLTDIFSVSFLFEASNLDDYAISAVRSSGPAVAVNTPSTALLMMCGLVALIAARKRQIS